MSNDVNDQASPKLNCTVPLPGQESNPTPELSRRSLLQFAAYSMIPTSVLGVKLLPGSSQRVLGEEMGIRQLDDKEMRWLVDAKYGMFIHWGLYAGPGRGEWMMHEGVLPDKYRHLATDKESPEYFAADLYNPSEWAQVAKQSGMKWMCLTTRHHDGYSLFASPHPNAFSSAQTHNRDFVKEYVKACREAGLKVGIYFSPINWRYPGYYDVTGTDCKTNPFGYHTDPSHKENARLMKEENYANVRWLLTQYGRIDHIFWDGAWLAEKGSDADAAFFHEPGLHLDPKNPWQIDPKYIERDKTGVGLGIMGLTRKHQPHALVNPRYGWLGDYKDEEGGSEVSGPIRKDLYQKCMTTAGQWGYDKNAIDGGHVIGANQIIEMLINCTVRNMVLLLNVGPDRHGVIPPLVVKSLLEAGRWIKSCGKSIYGTRSGPWQPVDRKVGYCFRDRTVYVHLMKESRDSDFVMPDLEGRVLIHAEDVITGRPLAIERLPDGRVKITGIPATECPNRVFAAHFKENISMSKA